jgi:hypothetical protein
MKQLGCGIDHPTRLAPRLKKGRAIPLSELCAFMACYRVNFTLVFTVIKLFGK